MRPTASVHHDAERHALGKQERRRGVAEVVIPGRQWQAGSRENRFEVLHYRVYDRGDVPAC